MTLGSFIRPFRRTWRIPLLRALRLFGSLAWEVYVAMNYRAHTAKKPAFIPWRLLMMQIGSGLQRREGLQKEGQETVAGDEDGSTGVGIEKWARGPLGSSLVARDCSEEGVTR
jgi:hypothetical protein